MSARLLLASPLGFLIGVSLGALGDGGSILAVPVPVFVAGQTLTEATSTSLLVITVNTAIALAARAGTGTIDWGATVLFTVVATVAVAVYTGARAVVALL
jgi:hypothetical protein